MDGLIYKDGSFAGVTVGFLWKTYNQGNDGFCIKGGLSFVWKVF